MNACTIQGESRQAVSNCLGSQHALPLVSDCKIAFIPPHSIHDNLDRVFASVATSQTETKYGSTSTRRK